MPIGKTFHVKFVPMKVYTSLMPMVMIVPTRVLVAYWIKAKGLCQCCHVFEGELIEDRRRTS